jgi:hypothetical protein
MPDMDIYIHFVHDIWDAVVYCSDSKKAVFTCRSPDYDEVLEEVIQFLKSKQSYISLHLRKNK